MLALPTRKFLGLSSPLLYTFDNTLYPQWVLARQQCLPNMARVFLLVVKHACSCAADVVTKPVPPALVSAIHAHAGKALH